MAIHFDYDYQKTFESDELLAVGTTTEMYKRGALPQPNPDDANSIWLAPNGSNSNAGTEAAPVLTLANAVSKMGAAKLTCHIFRNGYVGDIIFNETVTAAFLDTYNLQVEEGEIATIKNTQSQYISVVGTVKINGIRFELSDSPATDHEVVAATSTATLLDISHCDFIFPGQGVAGRHSAIQFGNAIAHPTLIARRNYIYSYIGIAIEANSPTIIANNLLIGNRGTSSASQVTQGINILNNGAIANGISTYRNNYFISFEAATNQSMFNPDVPPGNTHNFESCIFLNNLFTIITNATTSGGLDSNTINFDSCLNLDSAFLDLISSETLPSNFVINVSDAIDTATPLKLIDQKLLLSSGDKESAELQFNGKSTPDNSGRYFLDSPLVGLGRVTKGTLDHDIEGKPWDASATILSGVDWLPDGSLVVIDNTTDKVYNITRSGVKISEFNVTTLLGAASSPRCVCYDKINDTLWISDQPSKKIFQTEISGSTVISSFNYSDFDGTELDIQGISHEESTDSLWMMGDFNDAVYNTTKSGSLLSSFLVSLFDPGEIAPRGIAVAPDGTLWADGFNNDTISHITRTGTIISSFPSSTYDPAANQPNDLTVDKNGYLIITNQSADTLSWVIGDGIVDLSPFTEMTSLLTAGFNKSLDFDYPAASIAVPHNYINPVNIQDITGDPHGGYDAERREFILTFGSGIQVSNIQWKQIRDMLADKGTKRMYPLGASADLFTPNPGSSAGTFSDTDNSVAPTSATTVNMVPGHWRGFWVVISGLDYYISSNDTLKMYLIDPLGNGFPSNGAVTFQAQYILVNTEVKPFEVNQDNYRGFKDGQGWRESPDDSQSYDYQIDNLALKETSTLEENI